MTYIIPPRNPLRPVHLNNACSSRITAAAGTRLAGATFLRTSSSFLMLEFYNRVFVTAFNIIHTILLDQDFSHCLIFLTAALYKSGPCLSPSVAVHSLKPAKHHRLGKLLILPTT